MRKVLKWMLDIGLKPPKAIYDLNATVSVIESRSNNTLFIRKDVSFLNDDLLTLYGSLWHEQSNSHPTSCIIYLHSLGSNQFECINLIPFLCTSELALFSFDFSGCGNSEGTTTPLVCKCQKDVFAAYKILKNEFGIQKIGLWGCSMGASIGLLTVSLSNDFAFIVSDSAFSSIEEFIYDYGQINGYPKFFISLLKPFLTSETKKVVDAPIDVSYPTKDVSFSSTPLLMCQRKNDSLLLNQSKKIFDKYGCVDKQLYLFQDDRDLERPNQWFETAAKFVYRKFEIDQKARCYETEFNSSFLHVGELQITGNSEEIMCQNNIDAIHQNEINSNSVNIKIDENKIDEINDDIDYESSKDYDEGNEINKDKNENENEDKNDINENKKDYDDKNENEKDVDKNDIDINENDDGEEEEEEEDFDDDDEENSNEEEDTYDYSKIPLINLNDFEIVKKLGEGNFGYVKLVQNKKTNKLYAAKISKKRIKTRKEKKLFYNEIKSQITGDCPSVLKLIGINMRNFKNRQYPTILTDFMMNKSLRDNCDDEYKSFASHDFTPTKKYIILLGIALGMKYLHFQGIIHRDLKPENILLDENFYPYISDFGLSEVSNFQFFVSDQKFKKNCGTPLYMAPEILEDKPYTYKVDVYSFSLIAYELLANKKPFEDLKKFCELFLKVVFGGRPDLSSIDDPEISEFIEKCWSQNPSLRPSFNEIVEELMNEKYIKYFNADIDEVENYLLLFDEKLKTYNSSSDIATTIKKLADEGDAKSLFNYGHLLISGENVKTNIEEGVKYIKMAADKGFVPALARYGVFSVVGFGVPQNVAEAVPYLKKSAELKNSFGMAMYGTMLLEGEHVPLDIEKGIRYIKLSADQGNVQSMIKYAGECYNGIRIPQNYTDALEYFKKAADLGDDDALYMYAYMNQKGFGVPENKKLAIKCYKKAIEHDHVKSKLQYGKMLINKEIDDEPIDLGLLYLFQASELGNSEAFYLIGLHCYRGEGEISGKDKAAEYYAKASKLGNSDAMYALACMLHKGDGIEKNLEMAQVYYKMAAKYGNSNAFLTIGIESFNGDLFSKNEDEGLKFIKRAIDLGNPEAEKIYDDLIKKKSESNEKIKKGIEDEDPDSLAAYGVKLLNGDGVEENPEEAFKYFKKAADKGHVKAANTYGYCAFKGIHIPVNQEEGLKYLKKAADLGDVSAMTTYGSILFTGIEVPDDLEEASIYLRKAADLGSSKALKLYGTLLTYFEQFRDEKSPEYIELADKIEGDEEVIGVISGFAKTQSEKMAKIIQDFCDTGDINAINMLLPNLKITTNIPIEKDKLEKYLLKAIENGNSDAMLIYGKMLYNGDGIAIDKEKASIYFKMCAENGDPEAMLLYANMLFNGDGIPANKEESIEYYKNSAMNENPEAMLAYGKILYEGKYVEIDKDKGNSEAQFLYANMAFFGDGIPEDRSEGLEYYSLSVDQGNADAMLVLGKILYKVNLVEKAKLYFEESANKGNLDAAFIYATILFNDKSYSGAKHYYKLCIDNGNIEAMIKYGEIIAVDIGLPTSGEDLLYLKMAVDNNNDNEKALIKYAKCLYKKINESENKEEAVHYIKLAVDKTNDPKIARIYAKMLYDGNGVDVNKKEAARYYEIAALNEDFTGAYEYANMLYNGDGIDVDKKRAAEFYKIAAVGNSDAMRKLGDMLIFGDGIEMNRCKGEMYHQRAIENDNNLRQNMEMARGMSRFLGMSDLFETIIDSNDV